MSDISPDGEALPPSERQAFDTWLNQPHYLHTALQVELMWNAWSARAVLAAPQVPSEQDGTDFDGAFGPLPIAAACITGDAAFSAWVNSKPEEDWWDRSESDRLRAAFEAGFAAAAPAGVPQDSAPLIPSGEQP